MVNIFITSKEKKFSLCVTGHTQRDICLAISALTNSIVQYAEDFKNEQQCKMESKYKKGNVKLELEFVNIESKTEFLKGIDAVLNGLRLYQFNFKNDIAVECTV